jgi:hypothetical protein
MRHFIRRAENLYDCRERTDNGTVHIECYNKELLLPGLMRTLGVENSRVQPDNCILRLTDRCRAISFSNAGERQKRTKRLSMRQFRNNNHNAISKKLQRLSTGDRTKQLNETTTLIRKEGHKQGCEKGHTRQRMVNLCATGPAACGNFIRWGTAGLTSSFLTENWR